jgi:allantoate deiminase
MNPGAGKIMDRVEALARITDEPRRLTRAFCSPAMRRANDLVAEWMRQAGMRVREDAIGNAIGRYPARQANAKTLLIGSHLDTVADAGKFDGALGVILGIACVEHLHRSRLRLPFAVEVIGFADEEGLRFQTACLGSRFMAGRFDATYLRRKDAQGVSMAQAIRRFSGHRGRLLQAQIDRSQVLGYIEPHIEQGPLLEQKGLAVGIVSAIAGQSRFTFTFTGRASHAGTTPMPSRRDALCAAAAFVLAVEQYCARKTGLVATVGQIRAEPNVSNVIPGTVILSLDVRHQRDLARRATGNHLRELARRIAVVRGVKISSHLIEQTPSVQCSRRLSGLLERAVRQHQPKVLTLPSGAGHDAAILASLVPVAMLFIRCKGGISHHPEESVRQHDVGVALAVMGDFLGRLARMHG